MKLDQEEIDRLLGEIPAATPPPQVHIPMHRLQAQYLFNSPPISDGSSASSSPHSPRLPPDEHHEIAAAMRALSIRRARLATPRPYSYFHEDSTLVLDAGKKIAPPAPPAPAASFIYEMARDQHGCRMLQRRFEDGAPQDADRIFDGVIGHVADLMTNPFGNYLVQKLLDVCTEEQRLMVVVRLTFDPSVLIRVSLNTHGTRAVQKLIETLTTQQQLRLVVAALKPGFLHLIRDLNGNHVVQRCLQCLSADDNKFIFDAAAKHCVDMATHRHGCVVLQRCIASAGGEYRARMVNEVTANGLMLAQDAFGNYVVQFILDLRNPYATACLASQFEGNYLHLSTKKFSSNVVEKCLKVFSPARQDRIVVELLSVSRFDMLLQDPFANYVIQCALAHTKGRMHDDLVDAIVPHAPLLKTSPYCKRIFSRNHLRK